MSLDQIWEKIKSDQSEIYGMKILDVFLVLTKTLDSKHFNELTSAQKKKIGPEAAVDLLVLALIQDSGGPAAWIEGGSRFKKLAEEMGMEVLSKLDSDQIGYILGEMIPSLKSLEYASVFGDNLRKLKNKRNRDWIMVLLRSIQNRHNNKGSIELIEQLFDMLKRYDLVDGEVKDDMSYFFGANEFSKEARELAKKFLEDN